MTDDTLVSRLEAAAHRWWMPGWLRDLLIRAAIRIEVLTATERALRLKLELERAEREKANAACKGGHTMNDTDIGAALEASARKLCDIVLFEHGVYDALPDGPASMGLLDTKAAWRLLAATIHSTFLRALPNGDILQPAYDPHNDAGYLQRHGGTLHSIAVALEEATKS